MRIVQVSQRLASGALSLLIAVYMMPAFASALADPAARTVAIEAYGDSTTSGWQVIGGHGANTLNSSPVEVERILRNTYHLPVTVSNEGVGATELSQLIDGTDHRHPPWREQMARSRAAIVTLNFSLNDAWYDTVATQGIEPETPEIYATYLRTAIAQARQAGKIVVLNEPNPTCEPVRARTLQQYVDALRLVAASEQVPLVANYDGLRQRKDWQQLLTDCLHPSDTLYRIKAQHEAAVLARVIKQHGLVVEPANSRD
jgi:lysophospholipase L1-like esterase